MKAKGPDEIEPLQFVQYLQSFLSYDQQINFCSQQCSTMQCTLYSLFATFFNSKASKKSTNTDRKISFSPWKAVTKHSVYVYWRNFVIKLTVLGGCKVRKAFK